MSNEILIDESVSNTQEIGMLLLAGHIGGTKTDLTVFSPEAPPRAPLAEARFPSGDYPTVGLT
jgi:hypothetical protein